MAGFFMISGSVLTNLAMDDMQALLQGQGISARLEDDELRLDGAARLYIRRGFEHEFILVGDARELADLRADSERLSRMLAEQGIAHAWELYDRDNEQIEDYEFSPENLHNRLILG